MNKSNLSAAIIAGLLGCSALVMPINSGWASTAVSAKSSWAVSRVASIAQGNYCTMAQKYDNSSIISFARSTNGEYSLALDFQTPVFNGTGEETIILQAGSGNKQTFKVVPQSSQVAVIALGRDEKFFKALELSQKLGIEFAGNSFDYKMEKFKDGRTELVTCLSGLNSKANEITPSSGSSEASGDTKSSKEPSVEGLLAARPKPSMGSEPISSTETSVPVTKVESQIIAAPSSNESFNKENEAKIQSLIAENTQLKKSLSESRQEFEKQLAQAQSAAASEMNAKLKETESENKQIKERLADLEKESTIKDSQTAQRMTQQVEALKAENATLRNQVEIATTTDTANAQNGQQEMAARITALQAENTALKTSLEQVKSQQQELAVAEDDNALRKEIRTLKVQMETLQGEKSSLQANFDKLQKENESGQIKSAGGSWDLEQATRRYQESQREIRRLGAMLDDERLKCVAEKKEIEMMLFDPKIADSAQIAKLNVLEDQLSERDGKLKDMQAQLTTLQQAASPEKDQEIALLKSNLANAETSLNKTVDERARAEKAIEEIKAEQQNKSGELSKKIVALQEDLKSSQAKVEDYERKMAEGQARVTSLETQIASLNQASSDATELSVKMQQLQTELVKKDASIATLTAQMSEKENKLASLEQVSAGVSDLKLKTQQLETELAKKDENIANLNAQLTERGSKLASMEQVSAGVEDLKLKTQQLQTELVKKDASIATLTAQMSEKENKLASLESRLSEAQKMSQQIQQAQTNEKSSEALLATLKEDLVQKSTKLGETEAKLIQLQSQLAQYQAKSGAEQASASTAQTMLQQSQAKVNQLEAQIRALQQEQTKITAQQVAYVQPSYGTESASMAQPETRPETVNTNTSSLFPTSVQYASFLETAGIPVKGGLSEVAGGDPSSYKAYSWKTQSLYGSVEMRKAAGASSFDTVISQYLARAKSRCNGDFAAVPSQAKASGVEQSSSYEIACVGQGSSSSASVLFTYGKGIISTVAHEGRAEAMDLAIDARDRVAKAIR